MNISLTPKLHRFVQDKLAEGGYQSGSEIVRESLRLLAQREQSPQPANALGKIASGLAQARRGEVRDGETVFTEQRKRLIKKLPDRSALKNSR